MTALDDPLFDDLLQSCAFYAFIDEAQRSGGPPESEAVRRRAYRDYEDALRDRR